MMTENIGLRFSLVGKLMKMRYGDSIKIERDKVLSAWPPTGDHDRSMEGAFRAMSLSNSGNRPEESYTTDERIENDLDGSFRFEQTWEDGSYIFHRKVSSCPACKGNGRIQTFADAPAFYAAEVSLICDERATVSSKACEHLPAE